MRLGLVMSRTAIRLRKTYWTVWKTYWVHTVARPSVLAPESARQTLNGGRTPMTTRFFLALAFVLSAAIQFLAAPPRAAANEMTCSGLIGGQSAVTNIDGNVTVPNGKSCTLSFVNINGNVRVGRSATLIVSAYSEPSTIGGNIEATDCNSVLLNGNVAVGGNLLINSCSGTTPNGFQ